MNTPTIEIIGWMFLGWGLGQALTWFINWVAGVSTTQQLVRDELMLLDELRVGLIDAIEDCCDEDDDPVPVDDELILDLGQHTHEDDALNNYNELNDYEHEDYHTKNGYIISPGKFQGERPYTVYFYRMMLDGTPDESTTDPDRTEVAFFELGQSEYELFPDLKEFTWVAIWEDQQGFVHCLPKFKGDIDLWLAKNEEGQDDA